MCWYISVTLFGNEERHPETDITTIAQHQVVLDCMTNFRELYFFFRACSPFLARFSVQLICKDVLYCYVEVPECAKEGESEGVIKLK